MLMADQEHKKEHKKGGELKKKGGRGMLEDLRR